MYYCSCVGYFYTEFFIFRLFFTLINSRLNVYEKKKTSYIVIYSIKIQKSELVTTIDLILMTFLIYNCSILTIGRLQQLTFVK